MATGNNVASAAANIVRFKVLVFIAHLLGHFDRSGSGQTVFTARNAVDFFRSQLALGSLNTA
jgi:hypothetical protein